MGKTPNSDLRPWQVERRKYQNAAAQRRRRQKQKEKHRSQRRLHMQVMTGEASGLSKKLIFAVSSAFASDTERLGTSSVMAAENFSLHDIVKYGVISLGYAVDPVVLSSAENFAFCSWSLAMMSLFPASIDLECVLRAGIKTLIRLNGPQTWSGHMSLMALAKGNSHAAIDSLQSLGDPPNLIRIGFLTASLANCRLLGLDPCAIMNHDAESPFVRTVHYAVNTKRASHDPYFSASPEIQQHSPKGFANDMCPTVEQLIIPHHPYLDIIPWPSFRSRAIIASSMNPPLIDKSELSFSPW
ncbi:hypothetical protein FSARC_7642 [Fusarium sarcochroum]|uniref:BZIP domain-containing protein n=1 Tax=Fusarium sarcochroum TaxID=1208366 RepID=A0A8H4X837_9HYPO|nr:hypothetical protein FSARC_7642 [Fusarium sarcochroum]